MSFQKRIIVFWNLQNSCAILWFLKMRHSQILTIAGHWPIGPLAHRPWVLISSPTYRPCGQWPSTFQCAPVKLEVFGNVSEMYEDILQGGTCIFQIRLNRGFHLVQVLKLLGLFPNLKLLQEWKTYKTIREDQDHAKRKHFGIR